MVTGEFTNFTEFSNANHTAQEIYAAKQAGKEIKGQFLFGVPFLGQMPLEMRMISCAAGETELDDPPVPFYYATFGGFVPVPDWTANNNYKYMLLTLNYENSTATPEVTTYEIPQPGQTVPSAANEADGKVPVTDSGGWELVKLHDVAFTGAYSDLSGKPTIPVVPSNIVTGSTKSYTIVVSNYAPAAGTADNIITIVVPQ